MVAAAGRIGDSGGTPLAVSDGARVLGIVELKDVVKGGIAERFERFRAMGIRTVMITGDNPRTAAAIAREAGVDDFLAEATPEAKMRLIQEEQAKGKLVAMTGDGTNDAPALAQADVGVAMNTGTQAAKEAGNMVDLDSNPTKLLEVVEVGKQLLMTRGTLTTFSIANDVAKYFAILPALFVAAYPEMAPLDVMHLASPYSAILSAVIFNAIIIVAAHPAGAAGGALPAARAPRRSCAAPCSSTAWAASSPRSSGSSSSTWRSPPSAPPEERPCASSILTSLRVTVVTLVLTGRPLSTRRDRRGPGALPAPGRGQHRRSTASGKAGRLGAARPGLLLARPTSSRARRPRARRATTPWRRAARTWAPPRRSCGTGPRPTLARLRGREPGRARRSVPAELVDDLRRAGSIPHLSPAGALWQVPRVAARAGRERGARPGAASRTPSRGATWAARASRG